MVTCRLSFFDSEGHLQRYNLEEILSATVNSSIDNVVTEGALGKVYKAKLPRNPNYFHDFAIRVFDCKKGQGDELQTEISTLKTLQHKNIISVLGYYDDDNNEKIIIYENAFHGTLDQHLSDQTLTWPQRLHICLGVARGLNSIHRADVIHCDINSSKIFLDKDWEPKIYGFELSTENPQSWMHRLRFSHHFGTKNMTPKYDVYCFGVLLVEVLCGTKQLITNCDSQAELDKITDSNLWKLMEKQSLSQIKKLAYKCLYQQPEERPNTNHIVKELEEVLLELKLRYEKEHPIIDADDNTLKMLLKIPLSDIMLATNDFNDGFLAKGGFGKVYKANLDVVDIQNLPSLKGGKCKDKLPKINKTVAIKRLIDREDKHAKQGFLTEIELLTRCKHPNIIALFGFSDEADEIILVYEYASKGSLSDYLEKHNLTWAQRVQICLDIANGINYLHSKMDGKPWILHRDIKSDNILLDENLNAKIADFGLCRFHDVKQQATTVYTKNFAGTPFYMDPEYITSYKYKRATDIYSFGVVLFEVLSGRMAYDSIYVEGKDVGLAPIARRRFNEGTLKELIDPKIIEEDDDRILTLNRGPNIESFAAFSKIAYECLAETQGDRPSMIVVIKELENALNQQGETMVLSRFRLSDINSVTTNFAKKYCIGLDTNSMVYKAQLDLFGNSTKGKNNGKPNEKSTVAIKRITGKKHAFFAELEMRANYRHPNIVSPLGFCEEGDKMIIVYEHASKKSLRYRLRSDFGIKYFTWTQRLHICVQIARGLDHLHTKMSNQHGDINSANIFLDKNREAKIAYFGISDPTHQDDDMEVMYRDPEGKLGIQSDIYSFGVVLFEIFCGKLANDHVYINENDKGLASIARLFFVDKAIEKIIDPSLYEEIDGDIFTSDGVPSEESLKTFSKIAYECLGMAIQRPTLKIVIMELERALNFHEAHKKKLQISLKDIESCTENFCEKNWVGSDIFWKAYKGELPFPQDNATGRSTTIVAKRWDKKFDHLFRKEVNILFKHKHENVIGLVGYCNEMDEKIIVYDHTSKGSLDRYLDDPNLTWIKRLKICNDVASGLEFLHQGGAKLKDAVHMDIISHNILLNHDWKAKISNSEFSSPLYSLHMANAYLDPHHSQGSLTEPSDIYSFGVVLFEILCGRLACVDDCEDHDQSLGPLAKRLYEEGNLGEIVFKGINEQIDQQSFTTFAEIACQCLHDQREKRPTASQVVKELEEALYFQKDHEKWVEDKPWISFGSNGEINEMVSASQLSYENHLSHHWRSVPESRFDKVAEMLDISNLNIKIKLRSQSLSSGVNYGVHLVFKFSGVRKSVAKQMYVNLTYEMGDETLHAYFATWKEDEWMTIELYRFLNHKELDTTGIEFLLKSFSLFYCGNHTIYVEGVEFRAIDNKPEENSCLTEVQQVNIDPIQGLQTNDIASDIWKLFTRWNKKHSHKLSENATLICGSYMKLSAESRFQKVVKLLSTQVFRIKFKIKSKILLENNEYGFYLVFKLSEAECGLHYPVMVHDLNQQKNKQSEVVYFRSPRPWNINDFNRVPQEREDGWMEVYVWKFKSNHGKRQNDCISLDLKFVTYEGTMSSLIICDVEFRPM